MTKENAKKGNAKKGNGKKAIGKKAIGKKATAKKATAKKPSAKKSTVKKATAKNAIGSHGTRQSSRVAGMNNQSSSSSSASKRKKKSISKKSLSPSSTPKKKKSKTTAQQSATVNRNELNRNELLIELNKDPNAHKKEFNQALKKIVDAENRKIEKQTSGAKSGRSKGFFTQDRYNLTVEYLKLKEELKTINDGSDRAMNIKNTLARKFKGKTMDQFRLGGDDGNLLYRLSKSVRTKNHGGVTAMKKDLASLPIDNFDEVIAIDDGKTFDRINNIHWCSTNPLNHISSQQLPNKVSEKYGLNIPNNISHLLIKFCPVCKIANKSRNKMSSCGPFIFTAIDLTECESKLESKCDRQYPPYLLICLFIKKQYVDLIPMQSSDFAEVTFNLLRMFNAFGYPSSVRYYEQVDAPVQFVLDRETGSSKQTVDQFETRLLKWIKLSQSTRDDVGISILTTVRRRSAILDKVQGFLLIFIKQFLKKEVLLSSSFQGWIPLIQSFLNEDDCYSTRKQNSFFMSFTDDQTMFDEWEVFIKERLDFINPQQEQSVDVEEIEEEGIVEEEKDEVIVEEEEDEVIVEEDEQSVDVEEEEKEVIVDDEEEDEEEEEGFSKIFISQKRKKFDVIEESSNEESSAKGSSSSESSPEESSEDETPEKGEDLGNVKTRRPRSSNLMLSKTKIRLSQTKYNEWSVQGSDKIVPEPTSVEKEVTVPKYTDQNNEKEATSSKVIPGISNTVSKESSAIPMNLILKARTEHERAHCNRLPTTDKKTASKEKDLLITVPNETLKEIAIDGNKMEVVKPAIVSTGKPKNPNKDNVIKDMFLHQKQKNEGRRLVQASDNVTKLVPIKKDFVNQCYCIAVYQMIIGMKELNHDIMIYSNKGELSVDDYITTKPFTMANIIMGGIMKQSSQMNEPEAVPFDTIQYCRTKHLNDFFSKDGQEDASEFLGIYLDRLIDENPGGLVGSNIAVSSIIKKQCLACQYCFPNKHEIDAYINLCIPTTAWEAKSTSIQDLVNHNFENTINLEKGFECSHCKSKKVNITEKRSLQNPPSDIIFVVKRYQFGNIGGTKVPIGIKCDQTISVSSWLEENENLSQENVVYNLRSIICHNGRTYKDGHYKTVFVEEMVDNDNIFYHELNDDKHYSLSPRQFSNLSEIEGYIYHYSQRTSGNLSINNYKDQLVMGNLTSDLTKSCKLHWRQKPAERKVRGTPRQSINIFPIEDSGEKLDSTKYPIQKLLKRNPVMSEQTSNCIGDIEQMCLQWDTGCVHCTQTFPTESKSKSICFVDESKEIGGKGLFAKRDIKQDEYICRYVGKKVANGTQGEYVVIVNSSLTIDALQHTQYSGRFANHSCQPNCTLQKVSRDVIPKILHAFGSKEFHEECFIKATENITEGSEITFHYGKSFNFVDNCKCVLCSTNTDA